MHGWCRLILKMQGAMMERCCNWRRWRRCVRVGRWISRCWVTCWRGRAGRRSECTNNYNQLQRISWASHNTPTYSLSLRSLSWSWLLRCLSCWVARYPWVDLMFSQWCRIWTFVSQICCVPSWTSRSRTNWTSYSSSRTKSSSTKWRPPLRASSEVTSQDWRARRKK